MGNIASPMTWAFDCKILGLDSCRQLCVAAPAAGSYSTPVQAGMQDIETDRKEQRACHLRAV